jgi:hypothetical protein
MPILEDPDVLLHYASNARVHPNGFIQVDLSAPVDKARGHSGANKRLHVWPRPGVIEGQASSSPMHDHVFDMHSKVIRGGLTQLVYDFRTDHYGSPTHEIYLPRYSKASESILEPTGVVGKIGFDGMADETYEIDEGSEYTQEAFTFHQTIARMTPLVTVMTKTRIFDNFDARVLVPIGQPPDNDFKRSQYDDDVLWEIVEDAVYG